MENCGIYKITNIVNNQSYIGSSKDIRKRWYEHRRRLKKGNHHSILLQRSYNKYGDENFIFEVLHLCDVDKLLVWEEFYFKQINPELIILKTPGRLDGYKHTDETKNKLRIARTNQVIIMTNETKQKISESKKGKELSLSHKKSLSDSHKGKVLSEETKQKIRLSCTNLMMKEKQKLSIASRLKNQKQMSEEQKQNLSKQNKKSVIAIDDDNNIIYEFTSYSDASKFINRSEVTLWRLIKNKTKFKNLIWLRKEDYVQ